MLLIGLFCVRIWYFGVGVVSEFALTSSQTKDVLRREFASWGDDVDYVDS